jgi:hypothetical protein
MVSASFSEFTLFSNTLSHHRDGRCRVYAYTTMALDEYEPFILKQM